LKLETNSIAKGYINFVNRTKLAGSSLSNWSEGMVQRQWYRKRTRTNSCANRAEGVSLITLVKIVSNPSLPAPCCLEIDIKDLKYAQRHENCETRIKSIANGPINFGNICRKNLPGFLDQVGCGQKLKI